MHLIDDDEPAVGECEAIFGAGEAARRRKDRTIVHRPGAFGVRRGRARRQRAGQHNHPKDRSHIHPQIASHALAVSRAVSLGIVEGGARCWAWAIVGVIPARMKPRELIGTAQIPHGEELQLFRHDGDYIILLGRNELMNSRVSGSEEALAKMTCERLRNEDPHLLIGGYGMGFTIRAALATLGPRARVTVVELVPEIIEWARGPMAALTAGCLDDPRVTLVIGDVGGSIRGRARYDAILLDVDNGPDGLTRADNDQIYAGHGLAAAKAALKPGGTLAVWSAAPDEKFARRLKHAGFNVEEVVVRARKGKGARHVIWFAAAPDASAQ